eukprot:11137407-Prorocentrum_lima.AAC.1
MLARKRCFHDHFVVASQVCGYLPFQIKNARILIRFVDTTSYPQVRMSLASSFTTASKPPFAGTTLAVLAL